MSWNERAEINGDTATPLKTAATAIGIVVAGVGLVAGISKAYFQTPMKLEQHDHQLEALQQTDAQTARELREQRDILLEIRADLKYLKRTSNP